MIHMHIDVHAWNMLNIQNPVPDEYKTLIDIQIVS